MELRYKWCYSDIIKANAILDMEQAYKMAAEEFQAEEMKKKNGS